MASIGAILSRRDPLSLPPPAVISTIWRVACWRAWGSSPHPTMGGTGFVTEKKNGGVLLGTRKLNEGLRFKTLRALYYNRGH